MQIAVPSANAIASNDTLQVRQPSILQFHVIRSAAMMTVPDIRCNRCPPDHVLQLWYRRGLERIIWGVAFSAGDP
jgi:hypothetical protein